MSFSVKLLSWFIIQMSNNSIAMQDQAYFYHSAYLAADFSETLTIDWLQNLYSITKLKCIVSSSQPIPTIHTGPHNSCVSLFVSVQLFDLFFIIVLSNLRNMDYVSTILTHSYFYILIKLYYSWPNANLLWFVICVWLSLEINQSFNLSRAGDRYNRWFVVACGGAANISAYSV